MVSPAPGGKDARVGEGGGKAELLIYAFVARRTTVLAEYTEFTGNFPAIAAQCMQRLPVGGSSSAVSTSPDVHGGAPTLGRGEKLSELQDKASDLHSQARSSRNRG